MFFLSHVKKQKGTAMEYLKGGHSVYLLTYHIVFGILKGTYRLPVRPFRRRAADSGNGQGPHPPAGVHDTDDRPVRPDPGPEDTDLKGDPPGRADGRAREKIYLRECAFMAAILFHCDHRNNGHGKGPGVYRLAEDRGAQTQIRKDRKL